MLAKGHDFPEVTLVGILDVDGGLFASDFRAGERLSQLVLQVAGRAGRAGRTGRVLLQTRHPGHPLLQGLVAGDYDRVLQTLLQERLQLGLPPHNHQALIRADALSAPEASRFLDERVVRPLGRTVPGVQILGPVPALMSRRNNRHRWQCLLQADQREALHAALAQVLARLRTPAPPRGIRWSLDVDPNDFS
jgi:primosomal protein N' (replication factor Y)